MHYQVETCKVKVYIERYIDLSFHYFPAVEDLSKDSKSEVGRSDTSVGEDWREQDKRKSPLQGRFNPMHELAK